MVDRTARRDLLYNYAALAHAQMGGPGVTVESALKAAGVTHEYGYGRGPTTDVLISLRQEGMTYRDIGAMFGLSRQVVTYRIKSYEKKGVV